jgi:glycine/D-amino acid oxidase-like deaminating enzyme/nitrite reductase/ring-hydroxylating ferredoxin subunit
MQDLPGQHRSLWTVDVEPGTYPPLHDDVTVDVAVVGGGITGATTALLCKDAGLTVALLEADRIGSGTTGGTTGKVTSQHGLFYASAIADLGEATARAYGEANQAALPMLEELSDRHDVDAYASRLPSFVYTGDPARVPDLRDEAEAAGRLGLPASFVDTVDLPFEVAGAVRFDDQLQIHPTRLLHGFVRAIDGGGSTVHEHSRVVNISEDGDIVEVRTEQATVRARHVIVATLLPILDRGFEFARTRPVRAYGIAVELDGELPEPMYISAESPKRSLRHYHGDEGAYLVVVGENHETGHGDHLENHYGALIDFAREHFPVRSVAYRWSAQDYKPVDGMPYVGPLRFADHIQIATGFNKWGLSNGVVAAWIMSDNILERPNPWAEVFDANRGHALGRYADLVKDNLHVAKRFLADRIEVPIGASTSEIGPGEGRVIRVGGRPIAVHRTPDGDLRAVDATCTHLGCLVAWNDAETSWDCPCHGSRFAPTGDVLTGPAIAPLQPVEDDLTDA